MIAFVTEPSLTNVPSMSFQLAGKIAGQLSVAVVVGYCTVVITVITVFVSASSTSSAAQRAWRSCKKKKKKK